MSDDDDTRRQMFGSGTETVAAISRSSIARLPGRRTMFEELLELGHEEAEYDAWLIDISEGRTPSGLQKEVIDAGWRPSPA